ncbi:MAG: FAD-dependent oxidoreductase [Calditrichaceae bacterium]|nr:FAD-dependent oxidoreductase [Calditrichaceae bacterium]MBN2709469.1 FAD-dependent oxidoreductase [Calditrichaceae bacterium]
MMRLKNNFIFAPVKTGYSDETGVITEKHLNFYEARCKNVGAVTPEPLYLDKGLREIPTQIGIDNDDKISGLKKLTYTIHQYGTKVIAHLNHPGRMANPRIPGNYYLSSTDKACENGGAIPQQLDIDGIQKTVNLFADAAKRAEKADFDFIELQFGHGYLAAQFISPKVNDRTDEYGGSFENRIAFPLQILDAVKSATGLPVIVRISGDEMIQDGIKIDEMIKFSQILSEKSVKAIHVSAGTVCNTPPWFFQHMFVPKGKTWEFANKIKEAIDVPVIYVGQINTFADIDKIRNEFGGDYIALGRPLVADPDFIGKYLGKVKGIPRPCLACSEGCLGGVRSKNGLGCTVNPTVGNEKNEIQKADIVRKIAVIGGGLAGMQAAVTLNERGHKITLFEKDKLGGQFLLAPLPPNKGSLIKIVDYLKEEIQTRNIEVVKKDAAIEDFSVFDVIVVATGSKPAVPPIEGLKNYYWAEVLENHNLPENKRVLVVGGGLIGTEVAHKLLSKGNKVFIVEMLDNIARGMEMIEQQLTLKALQNENVNIFLNTKITKICDNQVQIEGKDFKQTLEDIDVIVMATGMKSYNPFKNIDIDKPFYIIGDASKVGKAQDAIKDAYETASII